MSPDDFNSITGLPEEFDIEEDLERAEQRVSIRTDTRQYGKTMTIIEGLDSSAIDISELAYELKSQLATGGTVDDGRIELQTTTASACPNCSKSADSGRGVVYKRIE